MRDALAMLRDEGLVAQTDVLPPSAQIPSLNRLFDVIGVDFLTTDIGYLWYNLIGCAMVLALGAALQTFLPVAPGGGVAPRPSGG